MAKQELKSNEQSNQPQETGETQRGLSRGGWNPLAMTPAEFFQHGPLSLMRRMNEEIGRVFGEFGYKGTGGQGLDWAPAIEVKQSDGKYKICAELPGVKADDVKLEITDEAVMLQGERRTEKQEDREGVHVSERKYGHFFRSIPLPEGAKTADAKAKFENGILEVEVPVDESKTQRRQIPIQSAPGPHGTQGSPGKAA